MEKIEAQVLVFTRQKIYQNPELMQLAHTIAVSQFLVLIALHTTISQCIGMVESHVNSDGVIMHETLLFQYFYLVTDYSVHCATSGSLDHPNMHQVCCREERRFPSKHHGHKRDSLEGQNNQPAGMQC